MKTKYFSAVLTALIFLLYTPSMGQEVDGNYSKDETGYRTPHSFGFSAGSDTGYGLSYRYFPKKFGFQFTTAPFFSSDGMNLSLGVMGMYSLQKFRNNSFYLYLGNHYHRSVNKTSFNGESTKEVNTTNITGVGAGIELVAWKRVGFNFMFGLGYYYFDTDDWRVNVTGGLGIFYKF